MRAKDIQTRSQLHHGMVLCHCKLVTQGHGMVITMKPLLPISFCSSDCQPRSQQTLRWFLSSYWCLRLYMSAALLDCNNSLQYAFYCIVQPCMTAYCLYHNTYDPGISPELCKSVYPWDMHLRSNLSTTCLFIAFPPRRAAKRLALLVVQ